MINIMLLKENTEKKILKSRHNKMITSLLLLIVLIIVMITIVGFNFSSQFKPTVTDSKTSHETFESIIQSIEKKNNGIFNLDMSWITINKKDVVVIKEALYGNKFAERSDKLYIYWNNSNQLIDLELMCVIDYWYYDSIGEFLILDLNDDGLEDISIQTYYSNPGASGGDFNESYTDVTPFLQQSDGTFKFCKEIQEEWWKNKIDTVEKLSLYSN